MRLFVPLLWKVMPRLKPTAPVRYGEALRSLWTLFRTQPLLRESSFIGALVFASFSTFWTTLVFLLDLRAGARRRGQLRRAWSRRGAGGSHRRKARRPAWLALRRRHRPRHARVVVSHPLAFGYHIAGVIAGVILLDAAAQLCQIANQTRIFGIDPDARSRLNTVYMVIYFAGAAMGSALSTIAWVHYEWRGVCVLALIFISLAGLVHLLSPSKGCPHVHLDRADTVLEA